MKYGSTSLIFAGAFAITGCGGNAAADFGLASVSAFEGIYQLTAASENMVDCAAPGASQLAELRDQFFGINDVDVFGLKLALLDSCSDVTDCRAKREKQQAKQSYPVEYTFTFDNTTNATTLTGSTSSTGFGEGTQCVERTYAEHVLTMAADHSVHLESRTTKLSDQAQKNGSCVVEPAKSRQEAAGMPCSSLKIFDGRFVQTH
jgi:hypothetical protein